MLTIFIRTIIIFVVLMITMRIMGKRQLGELDVGEFVITILLSEIATLPITNTEKSLISAIIPIATLAILEISSSALILRFPKIKKLLSSKPTVLISRGKMNRAEMRKVRISIEDLITQIRQNGIFDLEEVDYAILEENGKMSIIPKSIYRQPDRNDLNIPDNNSGAMHILISDGVINTHGINILNKDEKWLTDILNGYGLTVRDVLCMTGNDAGKLYIIKEDGQAVSH